MKFWKCVTPAATDAPQAALIAGRRNGSPRLSGQVSVSAAHNGNKGPHLNTVRIVYFLANCPLGGVFTPTLALPLKGGGNVTPSPFGGKVGMGVNTPPSLSAESTPADQEVRYPNSIGSHFVLRHFGLLVTIQYATTLFHVDTHNALTRGVVRLFDTNFQIDYD